MSVCRHSPSGPEIPDFILSAILLLSADRVKPQLVMWDTCTWTLLCIPAGYSTGHTVSSTHALNGEVHAQSFRNELHGLILFLVLIILLFNKDENKSFKRKKRQGTLAFTIASAAVYHSFWFSSLTLHLIYLAISFLSKWVTSVLSLHASITTCFLLFFHSIQPTTFMILQNAFLSI